jgi:putative zinc finger/helix-turn-helix YgiT family protein
MRKAIARVPHEIRGIRFEVEDRVNVCSHCGFITIPLDRADTHGRLTDQAYRRLAGIPTAEEIRQARQRLGMSQRQFAAYLGVGEASVKRWEAGVLPDRSSSELVRLRTDPEAARQNWMQLKSLLARSRQTPDGPPAGRSPAQTKKAAVRNAAAARRKP